MKQSILWSLSCAFPLAFVVGSHALPPRSSISERGFGVSTGKASFYEVATNGTTTASGVPLDNSASTAAHRTLPFGSSVRVTNLSNGLRETVTITDRGPFVRGRIIDLSRNAAKKIGMIEAGVVPVELEVMAAGPFPQVAAKGDD